MIRHRAASAGLALVLPLVLLLGAAACSDDDGEGKGTTTTEGDGPTTTAEGGTTTLPETTTTVVPPITGPANLQALLIDPAVVGEGFALNSTLGNGTFSGELCEDVTLEATWADQASQAVSLGEGANRQLVTQAVLDFADEGGAEAFVQSVIDGNETCLGGEVQEIDAGDEALFIDIQSGDTSSSASVVRVGARTTVLTSLYPTAEGNPVTPELLMAAGTALAG